MVTNALLDTISESRTSNASHGVRDSHARQATTVRESRLPDAGHITIYTIVGDCFWYFNRSNVLVRITRNFRYLSFRNQVVVNPVNLYSICTGHQRQQREEERK